MSLSPEMIGHFGKDLLQPKRRVFNRFLQSRHWYVYRYLYKRIYIYTRIHIYIYSILYMCVCTKYIKYNLIYIYMHLQYTFIISYMHLCMHIIWPMHSWPWEWILWLTPHRSPRPPHLHWIKCVRPASALAPHYEWLWKFCKSTGLQSTLDLKNSYSCFIHIQYFTSKS